MTMANCESVAGFIWPGASFCYSEVEGEHLGVLLPFRTLILVKGSSYIVLKITLLLSIANMTRSRM